MIVGGVVSMVLFFFSCFFLGTAEEMAGDGDLTARQLQTIGLLCCLVPGILLVVGSVFGGIRAFRKPKK
jgi:hypothetical protein